MNDINNELLTGVCKLLTANIKVLSDDESYFEILSRLTKVYNDRYVNATVDKRYDVKTIKDEIINGHV